MILEAYPVYYIGDFHPSAFPHVVSRPDEALKILEAIQFKGTLSLFSLRVVYGFGYCNGTRLSFTIRSELLDRDNGCPIPIYGSYEVNVPLTTKEFVRATRDAVAKLMLHECDEGFIFDGQRIFDPHNDNTRILGSF